MSRTFNGDNFDDDDDDDDDFPDEEEEEYSFRRVGFDDDEEDLDRQEETLLPAQVVDQREKRKVRIQEMFKADEQIQQEEQEKLDEEAERLKAMRQEEEDKMNREEQLRKLGINLDEETELDREDQGLRIMQQLHQVSFTHTLKRTVQSVEFQMKMAICAAVLILAVIGNAIVWNLWGVDSGNKYYQIMAETLCLSVRHSWDALSLYMQIGRQTAEILSTTPAVVAAFSRSSVFPNSQLEQLLVEIVKSVGTTISARACLLNQKSSSTELLCAGMYSDGTLYIGAADSSTRNSSSSRTCYIEYTVSSSNQRGLPLCGGRTSASNAYVPMDNFTCPELNQAQPYCACYYEPAHWSWYAAAVTSQPQGPFCKGNDVLAFSATREIKSGNGILVGTAVVEITVRPSDLFVTPTLSFAESSSDKTTEGTNFVLDEFDRLLLYDHPDDPTMNSFQKDAALLLSSIKGSVGLEPLTEYPYSSSSVANGSVSTFMYAALPLNLDGSVSASSSTLSIVAAMPKKAVSSLLSPPQVKTTLVYMFFICIQIVATLLFLKWLEIHLRDEEMEADSLRTEPRKHAILPSVLFLVFNLLTSLIIFSIWHATLYPQLRSAAINFRSLLSQYVDHLVDLRLAYAHLTAQQVAVVTKLSMDEASWAASGGDGAVTSALAAVKKNINSQVQLPILTTSFGASVNHDDWSLITAYTSPQDSKKIVLGVVDSTTVVQDKNTNPTLLPCYQEYSESRNSSNYLSSQCKLEGQCLGCSDSSTTCCPIPRFWIQCARQKPNGTRYWGSMATYNNKDLYLPAVYTLNSLNTSVPLVAAAMMDVKSLQYISGSQQIGFLLFQSVSEFSAQASFDANFGTVALSECSHSLGCLVSASFASNINEQATRPLDLQTKDICDLSQRCSDIKCPLPRYWTNSSDNLLLLDFAQDGNIRSSASGAIEGDTELPTAQWEMLRNVKSAASSWYRITVVPLWVFVDVFFRSRDACVIIIPGYWVVAFAVFFTILEEAIRRLFFFLGSKRKLLRIPMFSDCEPEFLQELVGKLKFEVANPGQMIVEAGSIGNEMYFINKGVVEVVSPVDPNIIFTQLAERTFFGEIALLLQMPRTANIRACTYCDLTVLRKQDFLPLMSRYPETKRLLTNFAKKRAEEILLAQKGFRNDPSDIKNRRQTLRSAPGTDDSSKEQPVARHLDSAEWEMRFRIASVHINDAFNKRPLRSYRLHGIPLNCYLLYINRYYCLFIYFITCVIMGLVMVEPENMHSNPRLSSQFWGPLGAEAVCLIFLWLDELVHFAHYGYYRYFRDRWALTSLFVKGFLSFDVFVAFSVGPPVLRFSRIARPLLLLLRSGSVRRASVMVVQTVLSLTDIGFLIAAVLCAFATGAILFFRDIYTWDKSDRAGGFWNFPEAISALFLLFNSDAYPQMMLPAAIETKFNTPYFVLFMLVSTFVFIPALIGNFYDTYKVLQEEIMKHHRVDQIANILAAQNCLDIDRENNVKKAPLMGFVLHFVGAYAANKIRVQDFDAQFQALDKTGTGSIARDDFVTLCRGFLPSLASAPAFVKAEHPVRKFVIKYFFDFVTLTGGEPEYVIRPAFELWIQTTVFLEILVAGMFGCYFLDSFDLTGKFIVTTEENVVEALSLLFLSLYFVELLIKSIGWTPWIYWNKNILHRMDILLITCCTVGTVIYLGIHDVLTARRIISVTHLRIFTVIPTTSYIVLVCFNLISSMSSILVFGLIIMHTFSIIGMETFGLFSKPAGYSSGDKTWSDFFEHRVVGFSEFLSSALTMVQFITTTNFVSVIEAYTVQQGSIVYFYFFPLLLSWSLLYKNLIIGIALDGFVFRLKQQQLRKVENNMWLQAHSIESRKMNACFICNKPKLEEQRCIRPYECDHYFHRSCVLLYPHLRGTCPQCRLERAAGTVEGYGELMDEMYGQNIDHEVGIEDVVHQCKPQLDEALISFNFGLKRFMAALGFSSLVRVEGNNKTLFYRPGRMMIYKLVDEFGIVPVSLSRTALKMGLKNSLDPDPKEVVTREDITDSTNFIMLQPYVIHCLMASTISTKPAADANGNDNNDGDEDDEEEDEEDDEEENDKQVVAEKEEPKPNISPNDTVKRTIEFNDNDTSKPEAKVSIMTKTIGEIPRSLEELIGGLQLWVVPKQYLAPPKLMTVGQIRGLLFVEDYAQLQVMTDLLQKTGEVGAYCRVLTDLANLRLLTPEEASINESAFNERKTTKRNSVSFQSSVLLNTMPPPVRSSMRRPSASSGSSGQMFSRRSSDYSEPGLVSAASGRGADDKKKQQDFMLKRKHQEDLDSLNSAMAALTSRAKSLVAEVRDELNGNSGNDSLVSMKKRPQQQRAKTTMLPAKLEFSFDPEDYAGDDMDFYNKSAVC